MNKFIKNNIASVLVVLFAFGILQVYAANTFPTTVNDWVDGDIIESDWANALESKIGIDGSATTTSLDYLAKNSSSTLYRIAKTDGGFVVGDGTTWALESGATARTSMGLGSMSTETATDYLTVVVWNTSTTNSVITSLPNLATIGTIGTGVWQGTEIDDAYISNTLTASNYLLRTNWFSTTTKSSDWIIEGSASTTGACNVNNSLCIDSTNN